MDSLALARIFLALLFVVALILACAWLARRNGVRIAGAPHTALTVTNRVSVGPRGMQVMVVEVENQRLVLGVTPGSINVLHTLPPHAPGEAAPAPATSAPATFQSILRNLCGRKA
ncbi:flagellar biosynthetic protein FliO [Bordetella sp. 15P40C-2]|uniref:flagellar biosynthetic protein FliO n=1 Tax=Bordetella sp. 15P40C-2 TaxID=2572246 RepID=UPI0013287B16|nr:flagellar biosynthetic protein FliO [Bordetella sp. 15P40C-2]MVW69962.1 flagellar biosynthetic protein FliO [Bordetella sp. 15P40C-2]